MAESLERSANWEVDTSTDDKSDLKGGHGEMSYYLIQALRGHSQFKAYLKRFMIADTAICDYWRVEDDDGMHSYMAYGHNYQGWNYRPTILLMRC